MTHNTTPTDKVASASLQRASGTKLYECRTGWNTVMIVEAKDIQEAAHKVVDEYFDMPYPGKDIVRIEFICKRSTT